MRTPKKKFIKSLTTLIMGVMLIALLSCSDEDVYLLGPQRWQDIEFVVEVRPGPPRHGMNEFIVIATDTKRRPAYSFVISIKTDKNDNWVQSIQDGHSGAYRRAIRVSDPIKDKLQVQVKSYSGEQMELEFPLVKSAMN